MISVIIPTHNRLELLKRAILSVESQTYSPEEVIIVNNGDNLLDKNDFDTSLNIKILNYFPNAGVSQARNIGAFFAKCKWLAFLDDDQWDKDYLKEFNLIINDEKPACIIGIKSFYIENRYVAYKNPIGKINIENLLVSNPGIGGQNIIIHKDIFYHVGGFDVRLSASEDKSLIIEILRSEYSKNIIVNRSMIVVMDKSLRERLTNYDNLVVGYKQFYIKYSKIMNIHQKMINKNKINYARFKCSTITLKPFLLLKFGFVNIMLKIIIGVKSKPHV